MTVVEIKEKINKAIEISAGERKTTAVRYLLSVLHNINSMLDKLNDRPKGKWVKTQLGYYDDDYGWECSNCKEIYCTEYDFEEMAYNYCPNCGARMEIEKGEKEEK